MKSALLHISLLFVFCVFLANSSLFDSVHVDLSYEHYAERRVESLPASVSMPCNSAVNLGYILVGLYWLLADQGGGETEGGRYFRHVFAFMALFYAPVQWSRLALLRRAPAVLDQWLTLPIFAWVPAWIGFIERGPSGWRVWHAAALELGSVLSYGLALLHERGFEVALGCHVALAVQRGVRLQLARGDRGTLTSLLLALLSCAGFVLLKLLDHWLAQFWLFRRFTGHFWSKVCDVLQFHFSFRFLTALTQKHRGKSATQRD